MAKITTRSEEVEQRTRCGEVVQRGKGLWVHPAPVGRGRFCSFLRDPDGWLQIADGGTNGGVRGQTGAERLPGGERRKIGVRVSDPASDRLAGSDGSPTSNGTAHGSGIFLPAASRGLGTPAWG